MRFGDRPVYVEFPDFGFGPAAAALTLISELDDPPEWHLVSSGNAAAFAREHLPDAVHHDLDTFNPASWERFPGLEAEGSLTISVTNPEFAAWAAGRGCAVGIVDTLDWMWPALPAGVADTCLHLAQVFFKRTAATRPACASPTVVQPIVDQSLWASGHPPPTRGTAVIGFGGMHLPLPFGDQLVASYTRWFLDQALPLLADAGVSSISIIGGRSDLRHLVPEPWSGHPAVKVLPPLPRPRYSDLLRSAEHLLLSPGLGSLYECSTSGLAPLLHPGWNMSMLLQAYHVWEETSYPYLCPWEWMKEAVSAIDGKPEDEGLHWLARRIGEAIEEDLGAPESVLVEPITTYLGRGGESTPLRLPDAGVLPSAVDLLNEHLRTAPDRAR